MKTSTPELIALLNGSHQFLMADLFTITPPSGDVLRYTSADLSIHYAGNVFSHRGPVIRRGRTRTVIGLEVDTLDLRIAATTDHLLGGQPFVAATLGGALDGAQVVLQRAFLTDWSQPPVGAVVLFSGRTSDTSGTRSEVHVVVKSDMELLNIKLPRNIYQAGCVHTVYDAGCAASRAAFTASGTVTGINGAGQWLQSSLGEPASWFDQGVISFTGGANAGVKRTVKAFASGQFWFALPLPNPPQLGDTFSVFPGCDKTKATCQNKFGNLHRFKGYPYIPIPETAT